MEKFHKVRTYSLITRLIKSLLRKARKLKIMFTQNSYYKPFVLVKEDEQSKVKIVVGKTLASPIEFDTFEEAENYLRTQPYEMFFNLLAIVKYYEDEENNKKTEANS